MRRGVTRVRDGRTIRSGPSWPRGPRHEGLQETEPVSRFGRAKRFPLSEGKRFLQPESVFAHSNARENALRSWREREKSLSHPSRGPKIRFPVPVCLTCRTLSLPLPPPSFKSIPRPGRRNSPAQAAPCAARAPAPTTLPSRPHHAPHAPIAPIAPIATDLSLSLPGRRLHPSSASPMAVPRPPALPSSTFSPHAPHLPRLTAATWPSPSRSVPLCCDDATSSRTFALKRPDFIDAAASGASPTTLAGLDCLRCPHTLRCPSPSACPPLTVHDLFYIQICSSLIDQPLPVWASPL